jgi:hypothetical protein
MKEHNTIIGLDVHKETVVGGVLTPEGDEVRENFKIANTEKSKNGGPIQKPKADNVCLRGGAVRVHASETFVEAGF